MKDTIYLVEFADGTVAKIVPENGECCEYYVVDGRAACLCMAPTKGLAEMIALALNNGHSRRTDQSKKSAKGQEIAEQLVRGYPDNPHWVAVGSAVEGYPDCCSFRVDPDRRDEVIHGLRTYIASVIDKALAEAA